MLPGSGRLLVANVLQGSKDAAVDAEVHELDAFFFGVFFLRGGSRGFGLRCGFGGSRSVGLRCGFGRSLGEYRGGAGCGGSRFRSLDVDLDGFGFDGVVLVFGHK